MQPLPIDMGELEMAFENTSWEMSYYLDRRTGEVLLVTEEIRHLAQESLEAQPGEEILEDLLWEVSGVPMPAWMQESVRIAAAIEVDDHGRYLPVPRADTGEDYRDMLDFIPGVRSLELQERLWDAIDGSGAFRRFRRALSSSPQERERWHSFKRKRVRARVLEWLEGEGITPQQQV